MRTWRVGTFSMGASLICLGLFLLFSQILGMTLSHIMMSWWPVILVVLGLEILVYLILNGKEKQFLKYDFISIFFVGILGTVGICFAILSSIGFMDKVEEVIAREERTIELPDFSYGLDSSIQRVVIQTEQYPVTIEGTTGKEVSMFGTYRTQAGKKDKPIGKAEDYVAAKKSGDTLYVSVKALPNEVGPFHSYETIAATILVPSDVKLEVVGSDNPITLKTRTLLSDWSIDRVSSLSVHVPKDADVKVSAIGVQELSGNEGLWKISEANKKIEQEGMSPEGVKNAIYQSGEGTHSLSIINSYSVSLTTSQ
jgi:hypothetical protein